MSFSRASVVETLRLTERMQRIVLHVADPATLDIKPGADSAVGIYFPDDTTDSVPQGRHYSVRHHDGPLITVDVVLHNGGPGTR